MKIEQIGGALFSGEAAFSPDGRSVAYVRQRPLLSVRTYLQAWSHLDIHIDRGDVWVAPVAGGQAINITKGDADGSGYWYPRWSPDGEHLAMLSTKGGGNVHLCVWEKATGRLTKLSDREVFFTLALIRTFDWIDNRRLVAVLFPKGEQSRWLLKGQRRMDIVMREWSKAVAGRETTASALDSGVAPDFEARRQRYSMQLTLLDITGHEQPVASMGDWFDPGGAPLDVAPDGRHIAFLKRIALLARDPAKPLRPCLKICDGDGDSRYQISIADASGRVLMPAAKGVRFVKLNSFRWSRDSRSFAFIGVREGDDKDTFHAFSGDLDGPIEVVPLPGCDPLTLAWAGGNRLLISAECSMLSANAAAKKRTDWWLVAPSVAPRNLTERFKSSPEDLLTDSTGKIFVGVTDGGVWRINTDSGETANLTTAFERKIAGIAWPEIRVPRTLGVSRIVVSVPRGSVTDYYRIDVASDAMTQVARPSESAELIAYCPENDVALFSAANRTATYLTLVQGDQQRRLAKMNTFLDDIAEGKRRMIQYRSLDGQELKGWLILPPNYQSGKRYPLVTYVYAGAIMGDRSPLFASLNQGSFLNLQLLAARGYAVLVPSMPLKPMGEAGDPYMELTKGVLPAVDKAIELGIVDPQRLAVMGHSYGGYSTYGLVTQTNRFNAAIAIAGISDLVSSYGVYDYGFRYQDFLEDFPSLQASFESGQLRMGNPPWKDWGRYLRNSPLFYVDRVQTALMMVHGDLDYVAIQQGEEFFRALYRQGKRARLIRYWGEGHILGSPANIRDMWTQIYAWLDEFCDITRDAKGNLVFDGDHVKSRNGAPALIPADFARFNEMELRSHPWVKQ